MNKFNLTMVVAVVVAIAFFGYGIFEKATYKIAEGDTVSISYSIINGDETYDSQSAYVVIGSNEDTIMTDEVLTGVKYGSELEFDTTLTEDVAIDDETTVPKGSNVTIEAVIEEITPASVSDTTSDVDSETESE